MENIDNRIIKNIPVCGLFDREITEYVLQSKHHLTPRSKRGKKSPIILLNYQCHKEIYSKFSDSAVAIRYNSMNRLRKSCQLKKFSKWIKKRPPEFVSRTKKFAK